MRHRVASKQLNRDTKHRQSLFKNLLRALVEHGSIQTTVAKAKVVQPIADKIVTKAKEGDLAARRTLHKMFGKRDVVNTLVERVAPVFKDRASGFTRITPVGFRAGDNAQLVQLAWVIQPETVGTLTAPVTTRNQDMKPKTPKAPKVKAEKKVAKKAKAPVAKKTVAKAVKPKKATTK